MEQVYRNHGVRFSYPEDWDLSEQGQLGEVSITVSSPTTAFWTVSLFFDRPDAEEILEAALDAFREEYDELDIYPAKASVCQQPTIARDIEFVCLELLNSAWLRAFPTRDFSALVLYQANDADLDETLALMEGITRSLRCEAAAESDIDPDDEESDPLP